MNIKIKSLIFNKFEVVLMLYVCIYILIFIIALKIPIGWCVWGVAMSNLRFLKIETFRFPAFVLGKNVYLRF